MKKTLVALAVLAASGASFAQVTITGELAMGYQATTTGGAASTDTAGLGVDTSQLFFNATEDLGGGTSVKAAMSLAGADRSGESGDGSVRGRNASLSLVTGVGAFTLASTKGADYLSGGVAGLGVYWQGMDGKVFSARTNRDTATLTTAFGPVTVNVSHQEGANLQGLGANGAGPAATTGQRLNAFTAKYATGPVIVDGQYLVYDGRGDGSAADFTSKDVFRLSGSYDLGVVQLGGGVQLANTNGSRKVTDTLLAIKAPVGALTLGAQWAQRKVDDAQAGDPVGANGTRSGYDLNAWYNLSKRTYVVASYARWDSVVNAANASNQTTVLLVHDF